MIKPTVGRKVWYRPSDLEKASMTVQVNGSGENQPLDATIVCVHNDTCVNLVVFDANGVMHNRNSTYLQQDGATRPNWISSYAEWMLYQNGQAKKEAEKEVDGAQTPA